MSEISHLATDKDIVSMWSEIINVIYLLIAGVVGGACTFWWNRKKYLLDKQKLEHEIASSRAKIEADKKSLRQQMITNNIAPMRQAWINDVRNVSSRILSTIIFIKLYKNKKNDDNKSFCDKHLDSYNKAVLTYTDDRAYIDLLMPFSRKGHIEYEADKARRHLKRIATIISEDRVDETKLNREIVSCKIAFKNLLKKEWDETKSLKELEENQE
ncbi:hypothetical protein [Providencia stuartii]|uniref:hypothetical protein n=1 Tax=Providencia stuartii TaxID=588 RepID=UPI0011209A9C|nr:hypothetical protein [Providencia stuartii]